MCRFLRHIPSYTPPKNAAERLKKLFLEVVGTDEPQFALNLEQKFQLLSALNGEFSYIVPNSLLHKMTNLGKYYFSFSYLHVPVIFLNQFSTTGRIQEYYLTPVENIVPYDKLQKMDLPPNLHILYDYHRFHPDTDTKFGGISAFPKSSTIVTGLKAKEKYKGYDAGNPWYDI